jgi:hypothetical protein
MSDSPEAREPVYLTRSQQRVMDRAVRRTFKMVEDPRYHVLYCGCAVLFYETDSYPGHRDTISL